MEPAKKAVIAPPAPTNPSKEEYVAYAVKKAVEANLMPTEVKKVIECETSGTWDPKIQSGHKNVKDGGRELSFGLAQIHLPDHPDVTLEEATDPYFAMDFLISEWEEGRAWQWTCWKIHYGKK